MPSWPPTSHSLVKHVQEGDPQAWQRFYSLYTPLVYSWVRKAGLQSADSQDVTQEVFFSVARGLYQLQLGGQGQSLRAWLRTITSNAVSDWGRRQKRAELPLADNHPLWQSAILQQPDESEAVDERTILLRQAVEIVSREQKAAWKLFSQFYLEGQPIEQVASANGVSRWTVYKSKRRIERRIRELLTDYWPDMSNPKR